MADAKAGKDAKKGPGKSDPKDTAKGASKDSSKGAAKEAAKSGKPSKASAGHGDREAAPGAPAEPFTPPADYAPRLKKYYEQTVRPRLIEQFGYKNRFEVPGIEKIVLNMGVGEAVADSKKVTRAAADLGL